MLCDQGAEESQQILSECCVSPHPLPEHSRYLSSPGTHVLSRYGLHFPETGACSRHLINSHLTDSSFRLPMLKKVLNYCSCRFLLQLRHQHSQCDQEAQHPRYSPNSSHLPDGVAAAKLYFLSLSQPELPSHDEPIDIQN